MTNVSAPRLATPPTAPRHTLRLAALPTAPHLARVFVSHTARQLRLSVECAETAKLLASELVTNAVAATGRTEGPATPGVAELVALVVVHVRLVHGRLRVDVWDSNPNVPKPTEPSLDDEAGRGLLLVSALSVRWGSYPMQQPGPGCGGKVVWCEVEAA